VPTGFAGSPGCPQLLPPDGSLFKRRRCVALLARPAERTTVNVVAAVAAMTGRAELNFSHGLRLVARVTIETLMRTSQRKLGLLRVIEAPERPAVRIVTKAAGGTQPAFMARIFVTGLARKRGILETLRAVTLFARDTGMQPDEREPCNVVVEVDFLPPPCLFVALLAFRAQLAFMGIAFRVATRAGNGQLILVEIACVARFAFGFCV
jgi:hypothetical protein